jgi:glycosyltransferase involved in cell wall biosynthesis
MKVLHYVDSSRPGGIETHLAGLLPALRRAGADARLLFHADYGPHPLRDALDAANVPHETFKGAEGLMSVLRARQPDILHSHGYKAALYARLARLLGGPPVVSTMHSGDLGSGKVGLYNRLDAMTARFSHLIAVSPALQACYPDATLIPNGIAVPAQPAARGSAIAFVGRFSEEKGPLEFSDLALSVPDERFIAFGDGPLFEEARRRAPANLELRGGVPSMDPHWDGLGLLVMPSRFEGLPMAALEAMARGIPVAAYAVGALPELLGDGHGFLAKPSDPGSLAGAVDQSLRLADHERTALSDRLRARISASYSIEACARSTIDLYRTLLPSPEPVAALP